MAVKLDNLDSVLDQLAKMEAAVATEIIREARTKMRAIMRTNLPAARKASPVDTGLLAKSPRVQSRSRQGYSTVAIIWDIKKKKPKKDEEAKPTASFLGIKLTKAEEPKKKTLVNYAAVVNFKKGQSAYGYATKVWKQNKAILDQEGMKVVKDTFKSVLEKHGVKVDNK